jgi:hypothetical protein
MVAVCHHLHLGHGAHQEESLHLGQGDHTFYVKAFMAQLENHTMVTEEMQVVRQLQNSKPLPPCRDGSLCETDGRANPFKFKHLKLCHSKAEVNKVPASKVVLVSLPDMECGFARDLFLQWCSNPKNLVIWTFQIISRNIEQRLVYQ